MARSTYRTYSTRSTPQSQPIPGSTQVPNSAGGFAWAVDKWTRLHRFLILGSEGGSYYAGERELTEQNAEAVRECIAEDGLRTVRIICDVSNGGRAPKNDPAIFALAMAAGLGDEATRRAALDALPVVCRIGTHLFMFVTFVEQFRGWGRALRRAVGQWYASKNTDRLAYQLVKYRQRDGVSHRDVLRLAHPGVNLSSGNPDVDLTGEQAALLAWAAGKGNAPESAMVRGFTLAQEAPTAKDTARLVREFGLPREALRTEHLNDPDVWQAMLDQGMPMTAMVRNLATMTRIGLLVPGSEATRIVLDKLADGEQISKSRIHPIQVLMALRTYAAGRGMRGSNTWNPLGQIVDALDDAYYKAFDNLVPTGKRRLIALDISGSMWMGTVAGIPDFTPAEAAGAMAMCSIKTGDPYEVVAFATDRGYYGARYGRNANDREIFPGLFSMSLSARQRLDDVGRAMHEVSQYMGGTDCSLPMLYANDKGRQIDVFEVYTDSETWAGSVHPSQALVQYRQKTGINAKLVVVGMVSNGFSIADPNDPGMLDVVGFDTATPQLISAFAEGAF
jgi:60 kDa SS-A/Ro ribonucleoprotein